MENIFAGGCTPCQCGDRIACEEEKISRFFSFIPADWQYNLSALLQIIFFLFLPAMVVRLILRKILLKTDILKINFLTVVLVSLPSIWFTLDYLYKNRGFATVVTDSGFAFRPLVIFLMLCVVDLVKTKIKIQKFLLSSVVLAVLFLGFIYGSNYYSRVEYTVNNRAITETTNMQNALVKDLGINDKASKVTQILKTKEYEKLSDFIDPKMALSLEFGVYGSKYITRQEFTMLAKTKTFSKLVIFEDKFNNISADLLLDRSNLLFNGEFKSEETFMNINGNEKAEQLPFHATVYYTYTKGNRRSVIAFRKGVEGKWYLLSLSYFDPSLLKSESNNGNINLEVVL